MFTGCRGWHRDDRGLALGHVLGAEAVVCHQTFEDRENPCKCQFREFRVVARSSLCCLGYLQPVLAPGGVPAEVA